jgi:predicted MFS family arabinose efflux permease
LRVSNDAASFWRKPIVVLVAAMAFVLFTWGIRQSWGLLLRPITDGFGWGREELSLAFATNSLLVGLASPFAGAIADKWGPVKVLLFGAVLYTGSLIWMAHATTPMGMFWSAGIFGGIAGGAAGLTLILSIVGRVAGEERRSLWFGLVSGAATAGQLVIVPIYQQVLDSTGWVDTVLVMAGMAALLVPLGAAMAKAGQAALGRKDQQTLGQAVSEARRHKGFLLLTAAFFVCGFQLQFIANHLPAYLQDQGAAGALGATAIALIGLFNMIGTWGAGVLGQRLRKKYLLCGVYLGRSLIMLVFIHVPVSSFTVTLFACGVGILWLATLPLTSGMVATMFGPRYMATLYGIVFVSHQVGSFMGVWLGGRLYDITGSYLTSWWMAIALGGVAALLHFPIDDRPVARLRTEAPARAAE